MPVIIPFIAYAAGTLAGYSAITVAAITLVASVATALYEQQQAQRDARNAAKAALQDQLVTIRSGIAPRGYVLGTTRTGGALQYIETVGATRNALDSVTALANNPCEIVTWFIGDDAIPQGSFPGSKYGRATYQTVDETFTVTGPTATVTLSLVPGAGTAKIIARWGGATPTTPAFTGSENIYHVSGLPDGIEVTLTVTYQALGESALRGQFLNGDPDQVVTDWDGYDTPEWDSNHRLRGVCHMRLLMIWDQNVYQNGAPAVGAALTGHGRTDYPFVDPRDNSNPVVTHNPAIIAAWWMTLPRFLGGPGIPSSWIDWGSVAAAANVCDELVTVRTLDNLGYEQIARYSCDVFASTATDPITNLQTILSSMAGKRCFTAGLYRIYAGAFRPATITLTDEDVVGSKPISVNTAAVENTPPNIVTATFLDAAQSWMASSPTAVQNNQYITDDGGESPLDLQLDATTDARRARYLMGVALESGRPRFGISLSVAGIGEMLAIGDSVQLGLVNRPSYAGRTFEITDRADNWDGTFDLGLVEIKAQFFALDPDTYLPVAPVSPSDDSYLWNPQPLTGLTVVAVTPTLLPDGTSVSRVDIAWDAVALPGNTPGAYIQIQYRITGDDWIDAGSVPADQNSTTITTALENGEVYQFQARYVNGIGAMSDWADAFIQIAGTALPSPTSLRLQADSQLFRVAETGAALPISITLTAVRGGGLSADVTFTTLPPTTLSGTGDTRTLPYGNMSTDSLQVTISATQASVNYQDTVTIAKVYDGASATADLTAPPTPTGLAATAFLISIVISWDAPTFTVGHGNAGTIVYAAIVDDDHPTPVFADASPIGSSLTRSFIYATTTGTKWAFWVKFETNDGVLSVTPAGGTNGVQAQTGLVGGIDLAPGLIDASKLADGSVTATALASGAITATKFANGLQPVTVITGTLPGTNVGNVIYRTDDGKLYKWNGATYTAQTAAADITGQMTDAQIAGITAAKLTTQITATNIAPGAITTPALAAGAVTAAAIAADTITATQIAANAITASELAAGAVTAGKIAANAVTAGTIAAGVVNAQQIAAGAITTDKLFVTGRGTALNDDPGTSDPSAWIYGGGNAIQIASISDGVSGQSALRGTNSDVRSRPFPVDATKTYRLRAWVRNAGGNGGLYLRVLYLDANGTLVTYAGMPEGLGGIPAGFTLYGGTFGPGTPSAIPSAARQMCIEIALNWTATTGYMEAQDVRIEQAVDASLIVDGAITATKLAANSIVAGTAAIQDGAIVNAMIGDAAIDNAKIINLSVTKLTAGSLGADIEVGTGRITYDNGTILRAQGTGFGSSNQFVDWFGVRPSGGNLSLCSESNAISYLKIDGSAYFGGSLSAGTLTTKASTSDTSASAVAETAVFGSNGHAIAVVFSFVFSSEGNAFAGSGANSAVIQLYRSYGGAAYALMSTLSVTGSWSATGSGGPLGMGFGGSVCSGSATFTDPNDSTTTRQYKAVISSRSCQVMVDGGLVSQISQTLSVICSEQ